MASFKTVLLLERTNMSPAYAQNEPEALMDDLDTRLNDAVAALDPGATLVGYQIGTDKAGLRRHYYLFSIP